MDIVKYVKKDGTGDYTDLATGFNDILSSGLAATGNILSYYLMVDNGTYSGALSGYIPYSGSVNIYGSGTVFKPTSSSTVSGIYTSVSQPNLVLRDFLINCEYLSNEAFTVGPEFALSLEDTEFINCISGIVMTDGAVLLDNISSHGNLSGIFLEGSGYVEVEGTSLSNYSSAIKSDNIYIETSTLFNNTVSIDCYPGCNVSISDSLIYGTGTLISSSSGNLSIQASTLSGNLPIYSSDSLINISDSILVGSQKVIDGVYSSGSLVTNSATVPSGWVPVSTITSTATSTLDPKFNNSTIGDFRLKIGEATGSPYIEYVDNVNFTSDVEIAVEEAQFRIIDKQGSKELDTFHRFVYKQGSTIRFTDYNKEIEFSKSLKYNQNLYYRQFANLKFSEYNIPTEASFSTTETVPDAHPWDWDWKTISSTKVGDEQYLVPRSIVDLEKIVENKVGGFATHILWDSIDKKMIKVFDQSLYRGISYDPKQSDTGISILWLLDSRNQTLIKQNAFSGEELDSYPLLCSPLNKSTVRPSGLVYVGKEGDQYRFVHSNDPGMEILSPTYITLENGEKGGDLPWIPTHLNSLVDIRGILAFKDHIYLTASLYSEPISDRSVIPTGYAQGIMYWYPSNDLFYNYTLRPEDSDGPEMGILSSGNMYPTDISTYEDGTFLVGDYKKSDIFRYKPAYDYALVQNSINNTTRVILRESYEDVTL